MMLRWSGIVLVVCALAGVGRPLWAASQEGQSKTLRIFALEDGHKRYFNGYDWVLFDLGQKIALVERARQGAVQMNAVMLRPPEVYVRELDRMYAEAAEARHIEVGQAIQGIAITLKDWDDGTDPDKKIKEALGP